MKLELFNTTANDIWKTVAGETTPMGLQFELEIYKKLLTFFQVGDYCYYIFNVPALDLEFTSKEVETLLGYSPIDFNMALLLDSIHPEDRPFFLNFENKAAEFLASLPIELLTRYKVRYDYRIRKKNGQYVRVLHQSTIIDHDENGGIIRTLSVHTDITHLKPEGKPVLSLIGLDGAPSYINIDVDKKFMASKESLSKREKEVLKHLIEGKLSKDISKLLNISKETVDKHRKNMLAKNNLNNTAELISSAIKKGWL